MPERSETIILSCIDFRFAEQVKNLQREKQSHLLSTAGASLDPEKLIGCIRNEATALGMVTDADHEDCGAYKNFAGDDSDSNHHKHMQDLKERIKMLSPETEFVSLILRLEPQYETVHKCPATVIVLGDPEILRVAFERIEQENLSGKHDLIARPFSLRDHDSILDDLRISLKLHRPDQLEPFSVYIFDRDEDNAIMLEGKVKEIVGDAITETIIVSDSVQEEVA